MLVLTRKSGEGFTVANTEITVAIKGGKIKVYCKGPDPVFRNELSEKGNTNGNGSSDERDQRDSGSGEAA